MTGHVALQFLRTLTHTESLAHPEANLGKSVEIQLLDIGSILHAEGTVSKPTTFFGVHGRRTHQLSRS